MGKLIETVNCVGIISHHKATRNNICSIQSQVLQLLVLRNAGMQLLFLRASISMSLVLHMKHFQHPLSLEVHEHQRLFGRGSLTLRPTRGHSKSQQWILTNMLPKTEAHKKTFSGRLFQFCFSHVQPINHPLTKKHFYDLSKIIPNRVEQDTQIT